MKHRPRPLEQDDMIDQRHELVKLAALIENCRNNCSSHTLAGEEGLAQSQARTFHKTAISPFGMCRLVHAQKSKHSDRHRRQGHRHPIGDPTTCFGIAGLLVCLVLLDIHQFFIRGDRGRVL